jgi:hypothetical protein
MRVQIEFIGKTPLLMHNEQLSDPENETSREIKKITDKKTHQTDSDKQDIKKLEWAGGLYTEEGNPDVIVVPVRNIIKCLIEAATITKNGKNISSGLSPTNMSVPLMNGAGARYKGKEELWKNPIYTDSRQVKVGRGRIKRTRPVFAGWAKGLGDARILGYGRFTGRVTKVK